VLNHNYLSAYRLPSLQPVRARALSGQRGYDLVGFAGGQLLIQIEPGGDEDGSALLWNPDTGQTRQATGAALDIWSMNAGGTVLRMAGSGPAGTGCLDVVPFDQALDADTGGVCGPTAGTLSRGLISPDGDWLVMARQGRPGELSGYVLARSRDVHAGVWRPVPLGPIVSLVYGWIGRTEFVAATPDTAPGYVRCGVDGACVPIVFPADLPDAIPLIRAPR
jgi:hypothetical protein